MKNKKAFALPISKKLLFIGAVVLLIILGFKFGWFTGGTVDARTTIAYPQRPQILSETNDYIEYDIPFATNYKDNSCDTGLTINYILQTTPRKELTDGTIVPDSTINFNPQLQTGKYFPAEVSLGSGTAITNTCSDIPEAVKIKSEITSNCKIDNVGGKQIFTCSLQGFLTGIKDGRDVAAHFSTFPSASVRVKIYKIGYEPQVEQIIVIENQESGETIIIEETSDETIIISDSEPTTTTKKNIFERISFLLNKILNWFRR